MNTKNFRTRQEFKAAQNPKGKDYIIGLDVGYSATKIFYESGFFVFPSYAKRLYNGMLSLDNEKDILYKDIEKNETYMVGYVAQDMIESTDTNDTDNELFARKRYNTKAFKIFCDVAIAISVWKKTDNRKVFIETGLPTSYVDGDQEALRKAICKPSHFAIKIGNGKWKEFNLEIDKNYVHVMPQPAGSLYSILIRNDGNYVQNAKDILNSNVLVMDIGFGTFDFYGIKNRETVCKESINDIGMREVLAHTSKKILEEYNEDIRVSALQQNLETGKVICLNEDEMKDEEKSLAPLLEAANKEVFEKAINKAKSVADAFRGYRYIVVAGGTGNAWYDLIKEWLSNRRTIKVMPSNFNDQLPFIYSNARGYYLFRYTLNKK